MSTKALIPNVLPDTLRALEERVRAPAPARAGARSLTTLGALVALGGTSCGSFDDALLPPIHGDERGPGPEPARRVPGDELYSRDHVIEVQVDMAEDDFQTLRFEGKSLFDTWPSSVEDQAQFDYSLFDATATLDDGAGYAVRIRKVGYLGGVGAITPALELQFGRGAGTAARRTTLANGLEDPGLIRQCLAFDLFAAAGYPAPRCNFAHVQVNDEELGYYAQVESIDEHMIARHFEHATGNLYSGARADFFPDALPLVKSENHPPRSERAALRAVMAALDADDANLVSELEPVLDLGRFRDFWALETLLGHWDGYANSANGYYLYEDPASGRLVFLPWDTDQAFVGEVPFRPPYEITVYYAARLANRLYGNAEQRELFRQRLGELNDLLWNEDDLLARANALAAQVPGDPVTREATLEYLRHHGEQLRLALAEPAPEVGPADRFTPLSGDECTSLLTPVSASFSTRVSVGPYAASAARGTATLQAHPDGRDLSGEGFAYAGPNPIVADRQSVFVGMGLTDGSQIGFTLLIPTQFFGTGTLPFHAFETFAPAITLQPFDEASIQTFGFVSDGEIELEQAGAQLGDPVSGRFHGDLFQLSCSGAPLP